MQQILLSEYLHKITPVSRSKCSVLPFTTMSLLTRVEYPHYHTGMGSS